MWVRVRVPRGLLLLVQVGGSRGLLLVRVVRVVLLNWRATTASQGQITEVGDRALRKCGKDVRIISRDVRQKIIQSTWLARNVLTLAFCC